MNLSNEGPEAHGDRDASDIVASDSEGEGVPVPAEMEFPSNRMPNEGLQPERTYNTFEEADAAADAEAAARAQAEAPGQPKDGFGFYGVANATGDSKPPQVKSIFKSAVTQKPDQFARVTWTDLASGMNQTGNNRVGSR